MDKDSLAEGNENCRSRPFKYDAKEEKSAMELV